MTQLITLLITLLTYNLIKLLNINIITLTMIYDEIMKYKC